MGRTGVRGRGALIRWGPNKSIMAVITRWKKHRGQFAIVDGQRLLEALVFKDKFSNDWKLPGVSPAGIHGFPSTAINASLSSAGKDSRRGIAIRCRLSQFQ